MCIQVGNGYRSGTVTGRERLQVGNGYRSGTVTGRERLQVGNGYRSGTVNSKTFVSRKFELTVHFKHEMLGK